jgi:hypothetical protein
MVVAAAQPPLRFDDGAHGALCEWCETLKQLRLIRRNGLPIAVRPKTVMQRYRAVGHHDTYRRMRETLDLGSTSDRTWRFMIWRGPPRAAPRFRRAAMLQSHPEGHCQHADRHINHLCYCN